MISNYSNQKAFFLVSVFSLVSPTLLLETCQNNISPSPRWLEEHLDTDATSDLLSSVDFVLCLDSLGSSDQLKLHVSKPPKEGSAGEVFLQHLNSVSEQVKWSKRSRRSGMSGRIGRCGSGPGLD